MTTPVLRADQGKLRRLHRLLPVLLLALFTGAVGLVALQARPSNRLVRYVSPPIDASGTRVSVLVPAGWKAMQTGPYVIEGDNNLVIEFTPPPPPSWMPRWLARWFPQEERFITRLRLRLTHMPSIYDGYFKMGTMDGVFVHGDVTTPEGRSYWSAGRETRQKPWVYVVSYQRTDGRAFEKTQAAIRRSLTLLPGPDDG